MAEKILCIQLKRIGDVLMTTPAVRRLAFDHPQAEIHFLTQPPADAVFTHHPQVRRIFCYPVSERPRELMRLLRQLRREHYTQTIDFEGLPKTALLSRLTGAPERIGFARRGRSLFYSQAVPTTSTHPYSALQKARLVTEDLHPSEGRLDFFLGEPERIQARNLLQSLGVKRDTPLISVSPVSRRDYKIWPADRFALVCDTLIATYAAQILFIWGPGEQHFVAAVRERMRHRALADYPLPSLSETAALLALVDLHLGNDNGPMHFATAAGTTTVAILGRPLARNWTPPDSDRHLAVEFDPGCNQRCRYPHCALECIRCVETAPVLVQIERLLHALRSPQTPSPVG